MRLESVKLYNYRNLADAELCFGPGVNFISGANGQGKTNLLEAIYLLSGARSFRTNELSELCRWLTSECSVFGSVCRKAYDVELGVAVSGGKRRFFKNNQPLKSATELIGELLCVAFTPSDLSLVQGGAQERRRFLDRFLVALQPIFTKTLLEYEVALKNKRRLLKDGVYSEAMYEPWNRILAQTGRVITSQRMKWAAILIEAANGYYQELTAEDGRLELNLKNQLLAGDSELDEQKIFSELMLRLPQELRAKTALFGPHRDELVINLGSRPARSFASQGQTRSIVLALMLAVVKLLEDKTGEAPIVVFDDVDAELDARRLAAFMRLLFLEDRQIFVSGTQVRDKLGGGKESALFSVEYGVVKSAAGHSGTV